MGAIILPQANKQGITDHTGKVMEYEPISCIAHPITRVYADEQGFVHFVRDGAEDIVLGHDPKSSRVQALQRMWAVYQAMPKSMWESTVCTTGVGLTYKELCEQTLQARDDSIVKSGKNYDKVVEAHHRLHDWGFRKKTGDEI